MRASSSSPRRGWSGNERTSSHTAAARGQSIGDGTPIHVTIPTPNPWVPLRILGLGKADAERVEADVFRELRELQARYGFRRLDVGRMDAGADAR